MAIKNYLKSVKDITAPLNWKSSPDSPKTQLAYITNAEKDLLVKSNLHGSMKGKPNKGPMGIISLDGMGQEDEDRPGKKSYSTKGATKSKYDTGTKIEKKFRDQELREQQQDRTGTGEFNTQADIEQAIRDTGARTGISTDTDTSTTVVDDTGTDIKDSKAKTPKKLLEILQEKGKAGLTEKQLVRIVNLLAANKRNENVLNPDEESVFGELFGGGDAFESDYAKNLEAMIKNYREGYPDYFADKSPGALGGVMGLMDSLTAGDYRGDKVAEEQGFGSDTLQGLKKKLSASDKAWLKVNRPELYYGGKTDVTTMPGLGGSSMDEMQDLASLPISGPGAVTDPELIRRIVEAREVTRDRDGSGGQSGIMTTVPAVVPDPDDPMIPVDPVPYPGIPTTPTIPKYPSSVITDYTQLGLPNIYGNQQMPTYGYANFNQTGQPVGLQNYLDSLRKRFGIG
jgi:hypothetical protein